MLSPSRRTPDGEASTKLCRRCTGCLCRGRSSFTGPGIFFVSFTNKIDPLPGGPTLAGFLLAQYEVVLHDVKWFGRNLPRGSFPCGMLLEFRDEFFLHAENHIRIDVPRVLLKQM